MNILVCDDDKEIVDAIEIYLSNENYNILKAYNGIEALQIINDNTIHLIIIDIMMPVMDGIKTTFKVREHSNIPIIILSAKSEDNDKIIGLNVGADDYITKPFNPLELIARVKSLLRRYINLGSIKISKKLYKVGELIVDDESKEVSVDGQLVHLTPVQYKILKLMIQNPGKVFSIDNIYQSIWDESAINAQNSIAVHIRKIREKIEINPKNPKYLKVVWGIGYKIEKLPS
ncbi:MAG: response regulator transcription factor [Peptostreptococcaceae bacterium]|jgi:DNA-binding response OmpR family regulator|nr:response regulator transcription factor [Peptostreptococcaceae bacterium]